MTENVESEKKRLLSVKRKKAAFKAKEQLIRDSLKNVDNKQGNNKIIFDDNIDESIITEKPVKKHKALFDEEDENDEETWNNEKFDVKENADEKYMKLQANFGNDSRFTLDERFIENAKENEENEEESNTYDLQKEKEWQFNILEDVLGVPVEKNKPKDQEPIKKFTMIRYDPTEDKHKEYELSTAQIEASTKNKKTKKKVEPIIENHENESVTVSKDVYYEVSDTLTKSLKHEGGFSLLKMYKKDIDDNEKIETTDISTEVKEIAPAKPKTFLNFDSTNPFKYDSSDDENEIEPSIQGIQPLDHKKNDQPCHLFEKYSDNLFFSPNDSRFKDGLNFFNKEIVSNNEFKSLRRELKQIVRTKIRKNVRKAEWWGNKRKIRKPS